jgi:hypothetical protein
VLRKLLKDVREDAAGRIFNTSSTLKFVNCNVENDFVSLLVIQLQDRIHFRDITDEILISPHILEAREASGASV